MNEITKICGSMNFRSDFEHCFLSNSNKRLVRIDLIEFKIHFNFGTTQKLSK